MATHIIHRQKVVLEVPAQQDAFGYQGRVSSLFNNGLQTAIEQVLDEMAAPGEVIRIDTLSLDLGVIDAQQFDAGFKVKLVAALKDAVLKSKAGAVDVKGSTAAETKPAATSQRDAFMYFVLHGSLPWYSNARNMRVWEEALLAQWQPADWKLVAEWLRTKQQQGGNVIQRIVWQFSHTFLTQLALHVYMLRSNAESLAADTIQAWHSDVANISSVITSNSTAEISTAVWLDIFDMLLGDNKDMSIENTAAWLVVTQLQRCNEAAVVNVVSNKSKLLLAIETVVIRNALADVISALEHKQPLSVIASLVAKGESSNIYNNNTQGAGIRPLPVENTEVLFVEENMMKQETNNPTVPVSNQSSLTVNNKPTKPTITPAPEDVLYLNSCGLVLLHPFLGAYFSDIGLIEKKQFIHKQAQQRAVLLLHYLATGETEAAEFNLGLQKLLCGYKQEDTLPSFIELTDKEKYESEQLLRSVIDYWPPLKNTSVAGFQQTFLQRDGRLSTMQSGWLLRVEQKAVDVLLGKLPWGYSTIRLPWMAGMLNVEWA